MKKIFLISLLVGACFSLMARQNTEFTITGQLPTDSFDGQTVAVGSMEIATYAASFILHPSWPNLPTQQIDSAVVTNGAFEIRGHTDQPYRAILSVGRKQIGQLIVEPGNITVTLVDTAYPAEVGGTPLNDEYNEVVRAMNEWQGAVSDSLERIRAQRLEERTWTYDDESEYNRQYPTELQRKASDMERKFMERNASLPGVVGHYVMKNILHSPDTLLHRKFFSQWPGEEVARILAGKADWDRLHEQSLLDEEEEEPTGPIERIPPEVEIGKKFIDASGATPDGKETALSELMVGEKLVLWDFWASWCQPCIKEMPLIAELYDRYKDDGFTVIGISSDQNRDQWLAAIDKYRMTWPQILSNGEDKIGKIYNVRLIPTTILIDENGTIIARRLRGEKLAERIREIMEE